MAGEHKFVIKRAVDKTERKKLAQRFQRINEHFGRFFPVAVNHIRVHQNPRFFERRAGTDDRIDVRALVNVVQTAARRDFYAARHADNAARRNKIREVSGKRLLKTHVPPARKRRAAPRIFCRERRKGNRRTGFVHKMHPAHAVFLRLRIQRGEEIFCVGHSVRANIIKRNIAKRTFVPITTVRQIRLEPRAVAPKTVHSVCVVHQSRIARKIDVGIIGHNARGLLFLELLCLRIIARLDHRNRIAVLFEQSHFIQWRLLVKQRKIRAIAAVKAHRVKIRCERRVGSPAQFRVHKTAAEHHKNILAVFLFEIFSRVERRRERPGECRRNAHQRFSVDFHAVKNRAIERIEHGRINRLFNAGKMAFVYRQRFCVANERKIVVERRRDIIREVSQRKRSQSTRIVARRLTLQRIKELLHTKSPRCIRRKNKSVAQFPPRHRRAAPRARIENRANIVNPINPRIFLADVSPQIKRRRLVPRFFGARGFFERRILR